MLLKNKNFKFNNSTNSIPIFIITIIPILSFTYPPKFVIQLDKKLYFSSFIFIILFLIFRKRLNKENNFSFIKFLKIKFNLIQKMGLILLFLFIMLSQNYLLEYETLSWDVPSYLVSTYDIDIGNIPYTTQWETKGPLLIYLYYLISKFSGETYIYFRIINDLILFLISYIIFKSILASNNKNRLEPFVSSFLFAAIFSMRWYVVEYSEIYCLLFISISYFVYVKNDLITHFSNFNVGVLIALSSLINQVSLVFLVPYLVSTIKRKLYAQTLYQILGFSLPHLFFLAVYILNDQLDTYLINYFILPFTYIDGQVDKPNLIYEFVVWLREMFNFNKYLYFAILSIFILGLKEILERAKEIDYQKFGFLYFNLLISFTIYLIGSWGFAHHLIYFIFYLSILISCFLNKEAKVIVYIFVFLSVLSIFYNTFRQSSHNLLNIDSIQTNYPLYKLSSEIDSYFPDGDYEIFALEYVLILYYLDKPNYSYIIHPTNHFQDYITDILIQYNKIQPNNVESILNSKPDVIICNSQRIHRGEVIINENFSCNFEDYADDYFLLETKKYREDKFIEYYFDSSKDLNVFIKLDR